jgi:predicted ATPase
VYSLEPTSIAGLHLQSAKRWLSRDGGNITDILERLGKDDLQTKERLEEYLRLILPGFQTVEVRPAGPGKMLQFWQQLDGGGSPQPFWPQQISRGTLYALGLLVALLQTNRLAPERPSLVGIEEPEAHIHPAALAVLLDAMVAASSSTQVLVATQSSDLLDDKDINTDSILAVSADRGQTKVGPIDEASRSVLRKRLYTVGELLRIGQLGPEASQCPPNGTAQPAVPEAKP